MFQLNSSSFWYKSPVKIDKLLQLFKEYMINLLIKKEEFTHFSLILLFVIATLADFNSTIYYSWLRSY